jgi:PST family polysaccharide transporter
MLFTGFGQGWRLIFTVISILILSRILTPVDFGIIAMVSPIVAFAKLLQDLGISATIVQRDKVSAGQISALFWSSAILSIILATTLATCAPFIAEFYREPRVESIVVAFSSIVFLSGLQSQQTALLNRQMRYRELALIDIATATANCVVSVIAAWVWSSYWALFWGPFSAALISLIMKWVMNDWRPTLPSFDGEFRAIARFGSGVSGYNILNYFARNVDNILIARVHGSYELGLYDRAYKLLLFPLSQVTLPLARVMVPLLSRLQSDPAKYRRAYIEAITAVMWCTQPAIVVAIIFSDAVFQLLIGPQWRNGASIFQWLGICSLHQVMSVTLAWLFLSQGRGGDYFKVGVVGSAITVISISLGVYWGGLGVAIAYTIGDCTLRLPYTCKVVGRIGPVQSRDLLKTALPHAAAVSASALVLVALSRIISDIGVFECAYLSVLSYSIYTIVMLGSAPKRKLFFHSLQLCWRQMSARMS